MKIMKSIKLFFGTIAVTIVMFLAFFMLDYLAPGYLVKTLALLLTAIFIFSYFKPIPGIGLDNRGVSFFFTVFTMPIILIICFSSNEEESNYNVAPVVTNVSTYPTEEQIAENVAKAKERAASAAKQIDVATSPTTQANPTRVEKLDEFDRI